MKELRKFIDRNSFIEGGNEGPTLETLIKQDNGPNKLISQQLI